MQARQEKEALEALQRLANEATELARQFGTDDDDIECFSDDQDDDDDNDDDDYSDDSNSDQDDDDYLDGSVLTPGKRRQKTKPPKDSVLEKHLSNMKNVYQKCLCTMMILQT